MYEYFWHSLSWKTDDWENCKKPKLEKNSFKKSILTIFKIYGKIFCNFTNHGRKGSGARAVLVQAPQLRIMLFTEQLHLRTTNKAKILYAISHNTRSLSYATIVFLDS